MPGHRLARLGLVLGACFRVCFVTGLVSHYQYQPWAWLPQPAEPVVEGRKMTDSAQRVAVVTGAAGALGGAVLDEFLGSGWTVVALDRPGSRLDDLGARPDVHPVPVDLANRAAVGAAFGRVDAVGAPAALIALAGGFRPSSLAEVTEDGLDEMWRSNVVGLLWCVQHAAPRMAAAGGGAVVTVGSRTALTGSAPIAYATSKAAVVRLPSCWPRSCGRRGSGSTAFD